jgi:hypothetical protein
MFATLFLVRCTCISVWTNAVICTVVPHVRSALYFFEKCAHFNELYSVNALYIFYYNTDQLGYRI